MKETVDKEILLKMIKRAAKCKKHKPHPIKEPTLNIEGIPSDIYPETVLAKDYRSRCADVRTALQHVLENF